jgi:phosphate transport system substrate-binding protein
MDMKKIFYLFYLFFFISQTSYCIDLVGSSTMTPITIKIGELFTRSENIPVSVRGIGSIFGIEYAKAGGLGMISRELLPQEKKLGLISIPIAYVIGVIIVNKNNPIKNLNMEQLHKIYSGIYSNWKNVGGNNLDITIVGPNENHGTYLALLELFHFKKYPKNFTGYQVYRQILSTVSRSENAMGYVGKDWVKKLSNEITVKTLKVNSIDVPNKNNLDKKYPLFRKISFVVRRSPTDEVMRSFIKFFYSKDAIDEIKRQGFVPIPLDKDKFSFLSNEK